MVQDDEGLDVDGEDDGGAVVVVVVVDEEDCELAVEDEWEDCDGEDAGAVGVGDPAMVDCWQHY